MKTLSKAYRRQAVALAIIPVLKLMLEDSHGISRNAKRTMERIEKQCAELLAPLAGYSDKTYRQLARSTTDVWKIQSDKKLSALEMLEACLFLAEEIRSDLLELKRSGKRPRSLAGWNRLVGSLFTLSRNLGEHWIDPRDPVQERGFAIGKMFLKAV